MELHGHAQVKGYRGRVKYRSGQVRYLLDRGRLPEDDQQLVAPEPGQMGPTPLRDRLQQGRQAPSECSQ